MSRIGRPGAATWRILGLLVVLAIIAWPPGEQSRAIGAGAFGSGRSDATVQQQLRAIRAEGVGQAAKFFPETGFSVDDKLASYYYARGGPRTFGPPISNRFKINSWDVQIFTNFVMKSRGDGTGEPLELLAADAIPSLRVDGRAMPAADQSLLNSAPWPGMPDYAVVMADFLRKNVPDKWEGMNVGFYQAFLNTVTEGEAFPNGPANPALLPGFAVEVWGLPVSPPARDLLEPSRVFLRFQRGVMEFDSKTGKVTTVPLGQYFKSILTGQGVPADLLATVQQSKLYRQYDPNAPGYVARPADMPSSSMVNAFVLSTGPGGPQYAVAQQVTDPSLQATPTPTLVRPAAQTGTQFGANPQGQPGQPGQPGFAGGVNPAGSFPTVNNQPVQQGFPQQGQAAVSQVGGSTSQVNPGVQQPVQAAASPAATGSDPCWGDEEITFAPEKPRVGNELLIAVTSSKPHPYGRLAGTERTQFVRERPGQRGYVWEWTVNPTYPSEHEYVFYVDSTIPCRRISIGVSQAPATNTPTPLPTPTPFNFNTSSSSGSSNNGNGSSSSDNGSSDNGGSSSNGNDNQNTPVISTGPTVSNVTHNSATITWSTNMNSDSVVEYTPVKNDIGTDRDSQAEDLSNFVISHTINLTNLTPGTRWYYRVSSASQTDKSKIGDSGILEFDTLAATPTPAVTLTPTPTRDPSLPTPTLGRR
jgi:hypothetical protein